MWHGWSYSTHHQGAESDKWKRVFPSLTQLPQFKIPNRKLIPPTQWLGFTTSINLCTLQVYIAQQPCKHVLLLKYILCDQKKMKFYFYLWEILFIAKIVFQILNTDIHMISNEFADWNQMHSITNDLPEIKETTKVEREMTLYILNVTTILWFLFCNIAIGFRHNLYII